jgi:hypothetical protein
MEEKELEKRRKAVGQFLLLLLFEKWSLNQTLMTEQEDDIMAFCREYGGEEELVEYIRFLREQKLLDLIPGFSEDDYNWRYHMLSGKGKEKITKALSLLLGDI